MKQPLYEVNLQSGLSTLLDALYAQKGLKEDKLPGGKADDEPDSKFSKHQLELGKKEESEHTDDPAKAKEIAKDHLAVNKKYYTDLEKAGLADEIKKENYISLINNMTNIILG
ncbi:MAG: hypothetical protein WCJ49_06020 [Deltaproteobacteria bacterium]